MSKAPIGILHVAHHLTPDSGPNGGWDRLQAALGGGLATAILETPLRRGDHPACREFRGHRSAPPADTTAVRAAFSDLLGDWHLAFETLMNRRWDLCENPYAKAWIMPGMIMLHEDPIGFPIDAHAEDIAARQPLEDPRWAVLMPMPASHHARIAAASALALPHAAVLNRALTLAARGEGHTAICPLSWDLRIADPAHLEILEA